jgi:hypothetical protein
MNRRSLEKMRTDRRLAGRSGWISKADLARETLDLPDAGGKIAERKEEAPPEDASASPPEAGFPNPG